MGYGRGARLTYGGRGGRLIHRSVSPPVRCRSTAESGRKRAGTLGFHPVRRGGKASSTASPIRERSRSGSVTSRRAHRLPRSIWYSFQIPRADLLRFAPRLVPLYRMIWATLRLFWVLGAVPPRLPDLPQNLPEPPPNQEGKRAAYPETHFLGHSGRFMYWVGKYTTSPTRIAQRLKFEAIRAFMRDCQSDPER